jgi:integrase
LARKAVDRSLLHGESIEQFRAAMRNAATRDPYERRLIGFLKNVMMTPDEFVAKAKSQPGTIEKILISFISAENDRVEKGEITAGTVGNALKAVKILLEMNDVTSVNWKKIKRVLPKARRYALDRIPTIDEIGNIIEGADIRGKPLTLIFISSGIREGAIEQLKVCDYTRIEGIGRLIVYNGDPERYVTFVSPEASDALDKYLTFRRQHGEMVSADSPLFRDKFDPIKNEGRGYQIIGTMEPTINEELLQHVIGINNVLDKDTRISRMKPMIQQMTVDPKIRIPHGERHSTLLSVANSLLLRHQTNGKTDVQVKDFFIQINNKLCDPEPLPEDERNQIWQSAKEYVSQIPEERLQNNGHETKRIIEEASEAIMDKRTFLTIEETKELWYYRDGAYVPGGDILIEKEAEGIFGYELANRHLSEIKGHISSTHRDRCRYKHNKFEKRLIQYTNRRI